MVVSTGTRGGLPESSVAGRRKPPCGTQLPLGVVILQDKSRPVWNKVIFCAWNSRHHRKSVAELFQSVKRTCFSLLIPEQKVLKIRGCVRNATKPLSTKALACVSPHRHFRRCRLSDVLMKVWPGILLLSVSVSTIPQWHIPDAVGDWSAPSLLLHPLF